MTRKEEIEKASVEYQLENKPMAIGGDAFADMVYKVNVNPSFVAGAEWADQNPIHNEDMNLEKEIESLWNPRFNLGWDENSLLSINHEGFSHIARHFFELGLKAKEGKE